MTGSYLRALRPISRLAWASAMSKVPSPANYPAGRSGFEYWTLRCTGCGHVYEAQVKADPMKSDDAGRWPDSDLSPK
jgi:hypothetical protein